MTRLVVDPLTRVEGHGRVELLLRNGRLGEVRVRMLESPRLFETLVVGRRYDEVPDLICRICAICSAVHKLTALQALEAALGVAIPPLAATVRELLLLGGHLQSHALHLFCLILPDLRGTADVVTLLGRKDPLAVAGFELKAFGNRIQQVAGGRVIHPVNPVFGGVAYHPARDDLAALAVDLQGWREQWPGLAESFVRSGEYPCGSAVRGNAIATGCAGGFSLAGERLWLAQGEDVAANDYARLLGERSRADSHAKDADGGSGPFLTGALARARLAAGRGVTHSAAAGDRGIHDNNTAQLWEIGWALLRIGQLLDRLLSSHPGEELRTAPAAVGGGRGTAVVEAPRGLLVHHYVVDEWGTVVAADVVTPTAINQRVMASQVMADLAEEQDPAQLRTVTERIIRAYDPCISCAVHLVEESPADRSVFIRSRP